MYRAEPERLACQLNSIFCSLKWKNARSELSLFVFFLICSPIIDYNHQQHSPPYFERWRHFVVEFCLNSRRESRKMEHKYRTKKRYDAAKSLALESLFNMKIRFNNVISTSSFDLVFLFVFFLPAIQNVLLPLCRSMVRLFRSGLMRWIFQQEPNKMRVKIIQNEWKITCENYKLV